MNRKRLEHAAGVLRDIGLAALLGGAGDAAINGWLRLRVDTVGVVVGLVMIVVSTWLAGLVPRKRRT